jgi:predicted nuclease of predicted toxin-antitoxin system
LKFKIDENLPADCAVLLRAVGFGADTVADERLAGADDAVIAIHSQREDRVLVTLDVLALMERIVLALSHRTPMGELWIVEPDRIQFRAG